MITIGRAILIDHNMSVKATNTKRIHTHSPWVRLAGRFPSSFGRWNYQWGVRPVNLRIKLTNIGDWRDRFVLDCKHGFHKASEPGGFQGVSDVCLDAANRNSWCTILDDTRKRFRESGHFNRIANRCARRMRFNVLHTFFRERLTKRSFDCKNLAFFSWCPKALSFAVRRIAGSTNDSGNRITILDGFFESLQQ